MIVFVNTLVTLAADLTPGLSETFEEDVRPLKVMGNII